MVICNKKGDLGEGRKSCSAPGWPLTAATPPASPPLPGAGRGPSCEVGAESSLHSTHEGVAWEYLHQGYGCDLTGAFSPADVLWVYRKWNGYR